MLFRKMGVVSTTLALTAVSLLTCSIWYAYKTGCIADLKSLTGSLDEIQLALHYSGISFGCFVAGILFGTFAIGLLRSGEQATRAGLATMFFFFGGFAFWLLASHFEVMGAQTCFAP